MRRDCGSTERTNERTFSTTKTTRPRLSGGVCCSSCASASACCSHEIARGTRVREREMGGCCEKAVNNVNVGGAVYE